MDFKILCFTLNPRVLEGLIQVGIFVVCVATKVPLIKKATDVPEAFTSIRNRVQAPAVTEVVVVVKVRTEKIDVTHCQLGLATVPF